jgi:DNA-binding NtrC family response regulator
MEKAIICVDDERLIRESLRAQLMPEFGNRFIFEFAESGEEGLEILDDFNRENIKTVVIISDWLMPKMKGDEFLMEVHKRNPEIVTVLLTGYADRDVAIKTKANAGLFKFITKPWEKNELFSVIYDGIN